MISNQNNNVSAGLPDYRDLFPKDDPKLKLMTQYSVFRDNTALLLMSFVHMVKHREYGSPEFVHFLSTIRFHLKVNLHRYSHIRRQLGDLLTETEKELSKYSQNNPSDSFPLMLYTKKKRFTLRKIEYYDYISEVVEYLDFIMRKETELH